MISGEYSLGLFGTVARRQPSIAIPGWEVRVFDDGFGVRRLDELAALGGCQSKWRLGKMAWCAMAKSPLAGGPRYLGSSTVGHHTGEGFGVFWTGGTSLAREMKYLLSDLSLE